MTLPFKDLVLSSSNPQVVQNSLIVAHASGVRFVS